MGDYGDAMMRNQNAAVQGRTKAQNRVNVLQLKLMGQGHPTGLTANLLKLFEPHPPLEYKPPPEKRKCPPYTGMAHLVSNFAEPGDPEYAPPVKKGETPAERKARIHQTRLEEGAKKAAEEIEKYDPNNDPNISGDPYKTLFVARLNYETTENRVKREFEAYGPIKRVCLITDKESNKPRGYAFIEYVHTRDMKAAYKQADGKKIDNRRVFVDVERGRTVPNWRPRWLGGGLGTSRIGNEEVNTRNLGREQVQSGRISRSEEPRVERDREREKSRDRGKERDREQEREQERSRERSHDRIKDHDHRDCGRNRERDRGRDRDQRDRTHERDRDRGRDRDHHHERERQRDPRDDHDGDRGLSQDREYGYDERGGEPKRERGERERNYGGHPETEHVHGETAEHDGHGHYDYYENQGRGQDGSYVRFRDPDRNNDRYEQMDDDGYGYDRGASKSQERDNRRLDRSISREY